jgi:hypothetical protein
VNNNNGTILIGALIGAGLGYLVADWYIETYIPEEGFELNEVDRIEQFNKRLEKAVPTKKQGKKKEVVNYTERFVSAGRPDLAKLAAQYQGDDNGINIRGITADLLIEDELGDNGLLSDLDETDDDAEELLDDTNDPCIISMETYAEDMDHTHTTLKYYTDDVLCDEAGVPINRPESFLPEDALVSFGRDSQDEDVVYVRNSEKKAMYEIVRLDEPYSKPVQSRIRRLVAKTKEMGNVNGEDS